MVSKRGKHARQTNTSKKLRLTLTGIFLSTKIAPGLRCKEGVLEGDLKVVFFFNIVECTARGGGGYRTNNQI